MSCAHPFCSIVPPHVLDQLAESDDETVASDARTTQAVSNFARAQRSLRSIIPAHDEVGGDAERRVYDSEQTREQQRTPLRFEGEEPSGDLDGDTVYEHAGAVRDYLAGPLERNSIDDQGMDLILNVHYGTRYNNAFWDGEQMTFGDGDGRIFTSFARSLDITAHEIFHGVTQFTSNLRYFGQSGALNEHFSDVFGAVITQHVAGESPDEADWLIGNEIMGPDLPGEALRSMRAPGTAYDNDLIGVDPQPAHMDDYYDGPEDNQGVHINSGIPNRAFYLVATDIGTDRAAQIWFQAFTQLPSTADFSAAAAALASAAGRLTRDGVVPQGSTQSIRAAFRDVGITG
jgi:Zn-dependent metalloprotease